LHAPLDEMVFEDAFMKLMKKIGSEAAEDVAMR